jgi:hypothetical protein
MNTTSRRKSESRYAWFAFIVFNVHVADSVLADLTYYSDPVNRDKKISAQRAYAATPHAVAVVSAYVSSAHVHVDARLPKAIAYRHAKEFSVEAAGSAEMEAEKIMVRACVSRSVLAMSVTHAMQVCSGVRKLLRAFDFVVDNSHANRRTAESHVLKDDPILSSPCMSPSSLRVAWKLFVGGQRAESRSISSRVPASALHCRINAPVTF